MLDATVTILLRGHGLHCAKLRRARPRRSPSPLFSRQALVALLAAALLIPAQLVAKEEIAVEITYIHRDESPRVPLSLLDKRIENNGWEGVQLGLKDNRTTGSFLGHNYLLNDVAIDADADLAASLQSQVAGSPGIVVANVTAAEQVKLADLYPDALIFNVRARDDSLRLADCRANLLHIPPSRSMLADALAQYLSWKRWNKVVLVTGRHAEDALYADAVRRAIRRFGLKLVDEKNWTSVPGARRTDSGHHSAQQEIPAFTQFKDYDVLIVADEYDEFGEYLPFRARRARLVAGTQGLTPTPWHRAHEQWGATQIQRRFEKIANRTMSELDYSAWLALRAIGESVSNTGSADPAVIREFLLSAKFKLAGFKGVPLTFRNWNGQLRQPVLLVAPRMLISVSPQEGFLHRDSELDTLGFDEPESSCERWAGG